MKSLSQFPQIIKTPTGALRTVAATPENAERIFKIVAENREFLTAWIERLDYVRNADDVLNYLNKREAQIKANEGVCFYIFVDDEIVGWIRFGVTADKECEIGYWLAQSATGHGYMGAALAALESELFKFGFEKIIIDVDAGNTPSENVARRAGYTLEKRIPMNSWAKCLGGKCDSLIFSKSKSDER